MSKHNNSTNAALMNNKKTIKELNKQEVLELIRKSEKPVSKEIHVNNEDYVVYFLPITMKKIKKAMSNVELNDESMSSEEGINIMIHLLALSLSNNEGDLLFKSEESLIDNLSVEILAPILSVFAEMTKDIQSISTII